MTSVAAWDGGLGGRAVVRSYDRFDPLFFILMPRHGVFMDLTRVLQARLDARSIHFGEMFDRDAFGTSIPIIWHFDGRGIPAPRHALDFLNVILPCDHQRGIISCTSGTWLRAYLNLTMTLVYEHSVAQWSSDQADSLCAAYWLWRSSGELSYADLVLDEPES